MSLHKANLDAWHVLQTVIDEGGFAQAANQLQRSQSAVSYSIGKLEEQLQLELLTMQGRRAVLTEAGQLLLARARYLLADYHHLVDYADHLQQGHSTEIRLWIDGLYPLQRLQQAILAFQKQSTQTRLSIVHGCTNTNFDEMDIVIHRQQRFDKNQQPLDVVELVAVAHNNHPLLKLDVPIERPSLAPFNQVVLESDPQQQENAQQNWSVTSAQQAKEYVMLGLAYGWLPKDMVENEIKSGILEALPLADGQNYQVSLYLQLLDKTSGNKDVQTLSQLIEQSDKINTV